MKNQISALLILVFAVSQLVQAQTKVDTSQLKHPVKACLFKVEGKGLEKPSWLFGTIHLGQKNVVTLHPAAEQAFTTADALYTEIDMDPKAQMAMAPLMMRKDGKTLTQAIGPEMTADVQAILTSINPALKVNAFDPMKTWVLAATLPLLDMQLKNRTALDMVLQQRAVKAGKLVGALETADSQVALFDQFSEKELQAMLNDTIKTMKEDQDAEVKTITRLLNVYLTGDIYKIAKFVNAEMAKSDTNPDFTKRLMKAILDDRNIKMADGADKAMQNNAGKSFFFAVGAAHYTGKNAVQTLLEQKGYKVTPNFD